MYRAEPVQGQQATALTKYKTSKVHYDITTKLCSTWWQSLRLLGIYLQGIISDVNFCYQLPSTNLDGLVGTTGDEPRSGHIER